ADATETPIGLVPTVDALDLDGLDLSTRTVQTLLAVDPVAWKDEVELINAHFDSIGERLPEEMRSELADLEHRLNG
ncbi:MAG: phosphoenolpyruvate carboxykinase domain-containing protein, partial [Actinomycetota bacterium]